MELDKNDIYTFLDQHHHAKHLDPSPTVYGGGPDSGQGQKLLSENDQLLEFFDLASFRRDYEYDPDPSPIMADGTTLSVPDSGSTETSSVRTPMTLQSSPESPLTDHDTIIAEEYENEPAGINDFTSPHDPFLFPRLDQKPNPPRKQNLWVPKKRSRSNSPNGHKRVVKDPVRTNQVRFVGSCTRCRIKKVTCTPDGTCDKCIKAFPMDHALSSCIRRDFAGVALDLSSARFAGLNRVNELRAKHSLALSQPRFIGNIHRGHVMFNRGQHSVKLHVALRNYCCMAENAQQVLHQGCVFARECSGVPSYDELIRWGEGIAFPEDKDTFEGLIEQFIKDYSAPCRSGGSPKRPQMGLLDNVHKMKVMYKICCEEDFSFVRENTRTVEPLPLPAKAEFRTIARKALESFESSVLRALDKYLSPKKIPEHETPVVWAALWQLLFIYRDLLRNRAPWNNNAAPLLNAVAVFYSTHFRTQASLKLSLDGIRGSWASGETQQAALANAFNRALGLRDTLHRTIAAGLDEIDHRLKALVVDPEMKVLNRRQTSKKSASGK
ncbi:hypothetical protein CSHISOI_03631 [Colletotrichum shisoi]|uniref:Uncharacterized protein n=1 Tax=Colletotrichum shisoi TaxID=2078593 RepID=A0A5Q4BZQ0_9PEZI|nr:hypothetical protein CSHISOI_03631 [Colletotrichum shisoi]